MTRAALRVIKLSGSLLGWPELGRRFSTWLDSQPDGRNVLIVGGGPLVEALRELDRSHALGPEASHWLSVGAMKLTAAVMAQILPAFRPVSCLAELGLAGGGLDILDVESLLREEEGGPGALPCSWDVTSDSIAAHVARLISASELVLLKSALPEQPFNPLALAKSGYLDAYFPRASAGLAVRCVNLRNAHFAELRIED